MIDWMHNEMQHTQAVCYGRQLVRDSILFLIITACLCLGTRSPGQSLSGVCSFLALRGYAGGVHVQDKRLCLALSLMTMIALLYLEVTFAVPGFCMTVFAVWLLSPAAHPKRGLTAKGRLRAKALCAALLVTILTGVVLFPAHYAMQARVIFITLCLQLIAFVKERLR